MMTRRPLAWMALALAIVVAAVASPFVIRAQQAKRLASRQGQVTRLETQNVLLRHRAPGADVARQLAKTKAALDKYRSVAAAKADGYVPASPCESMRINRQQTSYGGGMGIHYVNRALMTSGRLSPTKPPILLYTPRAGGGVELVGAEYFKPDADQNVKTDGDRPSLFGRAFEGPMAGHVPGMPLHYDLHVWLWKHNPSGVFASWNPDLTCP